jgi:hypothetical protein
LKLQTSKRSRSESEDPAKKKQKLVSKASNNQAESDVPKNHKSLQKPVTLSDDALFGTPIPNVSISKRQTSSKLPSLSVSASLSKGRTIEEAAPSVSDDTREICHPREEVSKHSSTTGQATDLFGGPDVQGGLMMFTSSAQGSTPGVPGAHSEAPVEGVELGFLESSLGRSLECGAR